MCTARPRLPLRRGERRPWRLWTRWLRRPRRPLSLRRSCQPTGSVSRGGRCESWPTWALGATAVAVAAAWPTALALAICLVGCACSIGPTSLFTVNCQTPAAGATQRRRLCVPVRAGLLVRASESPPLSV
eukprot:4395456-Prymnesium_polylepis.1